jgi:hypothetical protein
MSHLFRCATAFVAMSVRLAAQTPAPKAVPDEPNCPRCVISMRTLVTLGTDDGVGSLNGKPMSVNIDSRGRYWIFQELEPPTVFHPDGRVDRMIGRKGSGPGEFRSANTGIVVGDSMLVLDWLESRATMVGPDLKPGRIVRLRQGIGDIKALRWPSLLVTGGHMSDSRPPNSTMHRLSMETGETRLLSSFGPQGTGGSMGNVEVQQLLGDAKDGIWSTYWNRVHITKWNSHGKPNAVLTRRYAWYTGETPATMGTPTSPPTARTGALAEDNEGLLWLFIHTPAPTWREGWEAPPTRFPGGGTEYTARKMGFDKLFRTYVEVIDPMQARVVARHTINGYVFETLPGRRIALYRVDANGFPRVDIGALSLSGR